MLPNPLLLSMSLLALIGSAHFQSDFNNIKSIEFTFTDTNETLDWPLELQDMADMVIQTNTFIKFDLNATLPVTFILNMCGSALMARTTPFTQSTLFLDGPWLEYFMDPEVKCPGTDLTLEVYFGPHPTSGSIAFSQYSGFVPEEAPGKQTESILLNVTGTRKHMILVEDFLGPQETSDLTPSAELIFLTTAPVKIPFAITKCGLDAIPYDKPEVAPSANFVMNSTHLEQMIQYTHVYCPEKPYKWMLELTITTPSNETLPDGSAFYIARVPHTIHDYTMICVFVIFCILILILLSISTIYGLRRYKAYSTARRVKESEMAVFQPSKMAELDDLI